MGLVTRGWGEYKGRGLIMNIHEFMRPRLTHPHAEKKRFYEKATVHLAEGESSPCLAIQFRLVPSTNRVSPLSDTESDLRVGDSRSGTRDYCLFMQ